MSITPFFHVYHKYVFNMANINKIKLSGTTYSIQDENATKTVELTQVQYDALSVKDPNTFYIITDATGGDLSNYYTKSETSGATEISTALGNKQDTLVSGTNIKTINNTSILGSGNIEIQGGGSSYTAGDGIDITNDVISVTGKVDTTAFTAHTADTVIHVTSAEKTAWNAKSDFSGDYNDLTNKPTIPTVPTSNTAFTNDAGYITIDAISGKVDSSSVVSSVTSASTDNEIPTAKAVYDAIPTGGTGGGKAISAGTNISVTTGETADTINCTLPITKNSYNNGVTLGWNGNNSLNYFAVAEGYNSKAKGGSSHAEGYTTTANTQGSHSEGCQTIAGLTIGSYDQEYCHAEGYETSALTYFSHTEGYRNKVQGQASHAEGANNEINNPFGNYTQFSLVCSHAEGKNNKTYNEAEHASGRFNNSVSASTTFGDSGNTLFSVGNGTADNARHNAFEIRQNGDIYLNDGSKLQDTVSATAANTTALGGLKLVKLTQSEYDALSTKDSNTLYVIVN